MIVEVLCEIVGKVGVWVCGLLYVRCIKYTVPVCV